MTDAGVAYSDKELARLERKLKSIYGQAEKDIAEKMESFERNYVKKDALYREKVRNGEMSKDEYDYWKRGQVFQGNLWQQKKDQMAEAVYQANVNASNLINGSTIKVFTENANYASYMMEKGVGINFGFTLYDENTVSNLIKDEPDLLVQYKPKKGIDKAWNKRKITNQVTQGIIQGESIPKIAKRLSQVTGSQNMKSMMMHARTSVTNAQNAGRIQSYRNAQSLGINVKKEWLATLDGRTRDQHGRLDGQKVDVDKPFVVDGFEIQYPGDPTAEPALVYNCRCTLVSDIVDYPSQYKGYTDVDGKFVGAMSYDEWKNGKKKESIFDTQEKALLGAPRKKWGKLEEMITHVNPKYNEDGKYRTNCANCSVAHEIQMRGYDVEALPRDYKKKIASFWYDGKFGRGSWTDCFEGGIKPDDISAKRKTQIYDKIKEKMNEYGNGSRAVVFVQWDSESGHYFNVDLIDGELRFSDSQNGKMNDDVIKYFGFVKPSKTRLFRTDNKAITDFSKEVVTWNK